MFGYEFNDVFSRRWVSTSINSPTESVLPASAGSIAHLPTGLVFSQQRLTDTSPMDVCRCGSAGATVVFGCRVSPELPLDSGHHQPSCRSGHLWGTPEVQNLSGCARCRERFKIKCRSLSRRECMRSKRDDMQESLIPTSSSRLLRVEILSSGNPCRSRAQAWSSRNYYNREASALRLFTPRTVEVERRTEFIDERGSSKSHA